MSEWGLVRRCSPATAMGYLTNQSILLDGGW
jgi:hypothetical protein